MKVVVQRVTRASVTVGDREVSAIGRGLCVLLGITCSDTNRESEWMAKKILNLRLFEDPATGKAWDKSAQDLNLEVLCVSQFTLCHVLKGNKPDFHGAMTGDSSGPMYQDFLTRLGSLYRPEAIKGGEFGAFMQVHIQNDGPVTLQFETPQLAPEKKRKPQNPPKKKVGPPTAQPSGDTESALADPPKAQPSGDAESAPADPGQQLPAP